MRTALLEQSQIDSDHNDALHAVAAGEMLLRMCLAERDALPLFDALEMYPHSKFSVNSHEIIRHQAGHPGKIVMSVTELNGWEYDAQKIGSGYSYDEPLYPNNNLWTNVLNGDVLDLIKYDRHLLGYSTYALTPQLFQNLMADNYLHALDDSRMEYDYHHTDPDDYTTNLRGEQ